MAVEIREARREDFVAVGELTVAAYSSLEGGRISPEYTEHLRDVATRASAATVLVAVDDGEVVGGVTYVPRPGPYAEWDDPTAAGIRMLAVSPAAQRRGAGTALVNECVMRARADRRSRIILHSTPWMTAAHRIYDSAGFRRAPDLDWSSPSVELWGFVLELSDGGSAIDGVRSP